MPKVNITQILYLKLKGAVIDMNYFVWSKFSTNLVHKKNFTLICQVVSSYDTYFVRRGRISFFSLNELGEKP